MLDPKTLPDAIFEHVALYLILVDYLLTGELLQLVDYFQAKVRFKLEGLVGLFLRQLMWHQIWPLVLTSLLAPYPDDHARDFLLLVLEDDSIVFVPFEAGLPGAEEYLLIDVEVLEHDVRDPLRKVLLKVAIGQRQVAVTLLVVQLELLSSAVDQNFQRWYHCWVRVLFDDHLDAAEIVEAQLRVLESDMAQQVQVFDQIRVQIVKVPP